MRWLAQTLVITVASSAIVLSGSAAVACGEGSGWTCDSYNSGTQVDVVGNQTTPGGGGGGGESWWPPSMGPAPEPVPPKRNVQLPNTPHNPAIFCPDCETDPVVEEPAPPAEDDPGIPAVTAADLASFAPGAPALAGEPSGAGVVGMPVNFVASAAPQTTAGSLFGRAVNVEFTPVAFVFDHGDDTSARSASGGATWESLGQAQFSATPTSHAYAERGSYVAAVTVEYAARVDFGTGWRAVPGVVTATTGGYAIEVYEVRTALVAQTCAENPAGPGC